MAKDIKYKKQGDGRDSWIIKHTDEDGNKTHNEIVYVDPAIEVLVDISKVDISTLKPSQINELKVLLGI